MVLFEKPFTSVKPRETKTRVYCSLSSVISALEMLELDTQSSPLDVEAQFEELLRQHSDAIKNQLKGLWNEMTLVGDFRCLELVLYGIRVLAAQISRIKPRH